MHRGHAYLLGQLVDAAGMRDARPAVITFDHHPDEVITGRAPALLMDPEDRVDLLAAAGVAVTVVQHFDATLRQTPYDAFVERIRARVDLRGFVMTPDAAFGFERRGTPDALAELGRRDGFDVVGTIEPGRRAADGLTALDPVMPLAMPPDGDYAALIEGDPRAVRIAAGRAYVVGAETAGRVTAQLVAVVG